MNVVKDFDELLFQKNSVETKLKILRELDPLELDMNEIAEIVDYFRDSLEKVNLGLNYYGFTGTGGDVYKTINASVLGCIIAACDIKVCKVGSVGVTSKWGSLDLIREMGYRFSTNPKILEEQLVEYGFCFVTPGTLGIPYDEELLKARRILWKESTHCILKVILPSSFLMDPKSQITGVYDLELVPLVVEIFRYLGKDGIVVHSHDGIDEFSNTSKNLVIEIRNGIIRKYILEPEELGIKKATPKDIAEFENLTEQAKCSWDILTGKEIGPKRDFAVLSAALLLYLAGKVRTLKEGVVRATHLIRSGDVYRNFRNLLDSQKGVGEKYEIED